MPLTPDEIRPRLRGVISFPITPFGDDYRLDESAFQTHIDYLVRSGLHCVVIAGGTGELYSMTPDEIRRVYRLGVEAVGGRIPVIAGVGFNLELARGLARDAEAAGADAILVLPHYYGRAEDDGMHAYYAGVAKSVDIAVFPYARDHAVFSPRLVERLADIPNVVAFKDGQADLRAWARIRDYVGDRLVWLAGVGDDMVNSYFAAGAEGFTSSAANFMPDVALALFEYASAGNFAEVNRLLATRIRPVYNVRSRRRGYEVTTTKEAMNLLGQVGGRFDLPWPSSPRRIERRSARPWPTWATRLRADGLTVNAKQIWQAALGELQIQLSRPTFETWLRQATAVSIDEDRFVLRAHSTFTAEWLDRRLRPQIESSLRRIIGRPITLEVIVGHAPRGTPEPSAASTIVDGTVADGSEDEHVVAVPEALPPTRRKAPVRPAVAMTSRPKAATTVVLEEPPAATPVAAPQRPATGWSPNPNYTFAAYTVGQSNQTAHAAALSVAGDPGGGYNPLFIYGGVGLGKTHLLHAIANVVVRAGFRTLYVSAEEFTNDLVNAIREHRTDEFRLRYRTNDVLLIDDVQFIAGKEATQEEFFHTFNALHNVGHQIVLTSDRPPKAISNLAERLQSRFTWGIAVDIQLPDLETRRAILQKKAEVRRLQVPEPVLDFLASAIQSNIRELEGGLNRVVAYGQMTNQPISIQLARASIEDLVQSAQRRILSTADVLDAVCRYYKIELTALRGKARDKEIVWPRHVAMFLMRQKTEASLVEVGRALGGRDHSTVLSGCDRIQKELQSDVQLRRDVDAIEDLLRGTARG